MLALFLRYNYTRHVKLIARILFLFLWYFCGISRTVIWKFPLILFLLNFACFKFHDCKGKIKYLQEYSIITSQNRFLFIFRNSSVTDCYTRYPIKSKKSWCSAPKWWCTEIKLLKTNYRRKLQWKDIYDIKHLWLHT